jgi:AcrR family transcriptional regulator
MLTFEQLLVGCVARAADARSLPRPVLRAIVGGLAGIIGSWLREPSVADTSVLAEQLVNWTSLFFTPAAARITQGAANDVCAGGHDRRRGATSQSPVTPVAAIRSGDRQRLLERVLALVVQTDYRALSAVQIADEASVEIDAFFELFVSKDACFQAALDMVRDQLRGRADVTRHSAEWPQAVRASIGELFAYLSEHPTQTSAMATEALAIVPTPLAEPLALPRELASLLIASAPNDTRSTLALEGIAGALWHTIQYQAIAGKIEQLTTLTDDLSFIVLVPFVGAEAAATHLEERST